MSPGCMASCGRLAAELQGSAQLAESSLNNLVRQLSYKILAICFLSPGSRRFSSAGGVLSTRHGGTTRVSGREELVRSRDDGHPTYGHALLKRSRGLHQGSRPRDSIGADRTSRVPHLSTGVDSALCRHASTLWSVGTTRGRPWMQSTSGGQGRYFVSF